jgi:hypothetical protein
MDIYVIATSVQLAVPNHGAVDSEKIGDKHFIFKLLFRVIKTNHFVHYGFINFHLLVFGRFFYQDMNLPKYFSADLEFCKIDPWR